MGDVKSRGGGNIVPFSMVSIPWKKSVSAIFLDGTHIICPSAGYVIAVNATADGTGPGTIIVYDGHNAAGRPVWADQAVAKHAHGTCFCPPLYYDKGITIVVAATTIGMSVQWIPAPR